MSDRDSTDDEQDELGDEDESPPPPKTVAKNAAKNRASTRPSVPALKPASDAPARAITLALIALAVGGAAGWFAHIQKMKASLRAESAAPVGSGAPTGACGAWQSKICASAGAQSASCQQAKGATDLMLSSTCEVALSTLPETLAKLKAARASCDKLVAKLCSDLPPGSKTCGMVKERTPSFPHERCDQMLQNYDKVIAELKQMDQQGAPQMGAPQMGAPQMSAPQMSAPQMGAAQRMPHIALPPGSTPP